MVSIIGLACRVSVELPKDFGHRDPQIQDSDPAHRAAHIRVGPERVPDRLRRPGDRPCEVIGGPPIRPRIYQQEESQLEAKDDEYDRAKTLEPAGTRWDNRRRACRGLGMTCDDLRSRIAHT